MKVKDMLEILSTLNPNAEVIIQKDSEGNRYSPLKGIYTEKVYVPETPWVGAIYSIHDSAEEIGIDINEWDSLRAKPLCVVVYPIN